MTAFLDALGIVCSLGKGQSDVARALLAGERSGIREQSGWVPGLSVPIGRVSAPLEAIPEPWPGSDTRTHQLLWTAASELRESLELAIARYGAERVGVVLGTSTTGVHEATAGIAAYQRDGHFPPQYHYVPQELNAPAAFLAESLGLTGPRYVISTACTSSGRALQSARRLIAQGVCDAVVCGGADSLCALTLNGFHALEATSMHPCNPFSRNRDGINIGEGAALFLMSRDSLSVDASSSIALLGAAATSDAYHISAPHPEGRGASAAMRNALGQAGLVAYDIDYLNLHGTATHQNDAMESHAVQAVFADTVPCSSTKAMTGHTLGAAGAIEAAFCWLALSTHNPLGRLPPHVWDGQADPQLPPLQWATTEHRFHRQRGRRLMSNSFAFGGSNLSLILGDAS